MHSFFAPAFCLAMFATTIFTQSASTEEAPDAIPFTVSEIQTAAVLGVLSAVGVPTPTTVAPSQITALNAIFSSIELDFFTNSIFAVVPSTLVVSGTEPPALSSSIVSILDGALATHNPSALPTLEALVSGQPFSSNLIAQASSAFKVIAAEKSAIAEAVIDELNVTLRMNATSSQGGIGMGGRSSSNSKAGAARPTAPAVRGLGGAAAGVAAGVLGVALL